MTPNRRRALGWLCGGAAALLLVAELLGDAGLSTPPHQVFLGGKISPFLACACVGPFPLLLSLGRLSRRGTRFGWALLGFALAVAGGAPFWLGAPLPERVALGLISRAFYGLGAIGLVGLVTFACTGRPEARGRAWETLGMALLLPAFVVLSDFFLPLTVLLHPRTQDASLYAFEKGLGWMPSVRLSAAFAHLPVLSALCEVVYLTLPLGFVALMVLSLRRTEAARLSPVVGFLVVGAAGYGLYHLFPVVGPQDFFGAAFPEHLEAVGVGLARAGVPVEPLAPRNCVPSLHTAWALIAFWYARPLRWGWRVMFGAALALTVLATLGLGFHYFGDVVVAVPFTLAVLTLCERREVRASPWGVRVLWTCVAATAGWLLWFRFGGPLTLRSPWIGWSLSALTVGLCGVGERRIARLRAGLPALPEEVSGAQPSIDGWTGS